jgi:hypothetical protein
MFMGFDEYVTVRSFEKRREATTQSMQGFAPVFGGH